MRSATPYGQRSTRLFTPTGRDADEPVAGYYRHKLTRGGHPVGVHIFYGPPHDPVTGEEMDRSHRWQATVNNAPTEIEFLWPSCGRDPIDKAEHDHLAAVQAWAKEHAPNTPQADPRRAIDLHTSPILI